MVSTYTRGVVSLKRSDFFKTSGHDREATDIILLPSGFVHFYDKQEKCVVVVAREQIDFIHDAQVMRQP